MFSGIQKKISAMTWINIGLVSEINPFQLTGFFYTPLKNHKASRICFKGYRKRLLNESFHKMCRFLHCIYYAELFMIFLH